MNLKIFIFMIILFFLFNFSKKNNINENFSINEFYNKDCETTDETRKKCSVEFSKISSNLFNFCVDKNKDYNIDENTNNDLCQKWIGLISSDCITEKCVDNTINKINDWSKTKENMSTYSNLEKLEKLKHKYKLYNDNKFNDIISKAKNSFTQKKNLLNEINKINSLNNEIVKKIKANKDLDKEEVESFTEYVEKYPLEEKKKIFNLIDEGHDIYFKLKNIDRDNSLKINDRINNLREKADLEGKETFKKIIYNYISDADKQNLKNIINNYENYYLTN